MNSIPSACQNLAFLADLEEIKVLGQGGNGKVFHVRNKETNKEYALKWIHLDYSQDCGVSNEEFFALQKQQWNEIFTMKSLSSTKEIARFDNQISYTHPDGQSVDSFILMELLTPLDDLLKNKTLTVGMSKELVTNISTALTACHKLNIIHGDIKPDNILYGEDCFKLADFGVSLRLQDNRYLRPGGTPYYLPPECHQSQEATALGDIYSLGMTLYILFNDGLLPFQKTPIEQDELDAWKQCCELAERQEGSYPPPKYAPKEIADVILRATAVKVQDRFQTPQALADAYCEAVGKLTDEQRGLPLPYGEHQIVYRSTMAETPKFQNISRKRATSTSAELSPFAQQDGFSTVNAADLKPKTTDAVPATATQTNPQPKKLPVPIIAACAGAAVLLILLALVLLLGSGKPLTISVQPGAFEATVTLGNATDDVSLLVSASNTGEGFTVTSADSVVTLTGLAPETSYTVQASMDGQTAQEAFRTKAAAIEHFQPVSQNVFTCSVTLLDSNSNLTALLSNDEVTLLPDNQLTLRDTRLISQNTAILLSCSMQCEPGAFEDSTMLLVLRAPDDVVTQAIPVPAWTLSSPSFRTTQNFSALFDEYYNRHGRHFEGEVKLEIYWLNELIGSAELILN